MQQKLKELMETDIQKTLQMLQMENQMHMQQTKMEMYMDGEMEATIKLMIQQLQNYIQQR